MPHTLHCLADTATLAVQQACSSTQPLSLSCLRTLLFMGADIDAYDSEGYTPLMRATLQRAPEKVKMLLACGANPRLMGPNGQEALHMAMSRGYADICQILTFAYNTPPAASRKRFSIKPYGLG